MSSRHIVKYGLMTARSSTIHEPGIPKSVQDHWFSGHTMLLQYRIRESRFSVSWNVWKSLYKPPSSLSPRQLTDPRCFSVLLESVEDTIQTPRFTLREQNG